MAANLLEFAMLRWTMLCCILLGACASPSPPAQTDLFHDEAFAPPTQRIDAKDVFAMSPAMQQVLDTALAQHRPTLATRSAFSDPRRELLDVLFGQRTLIIEYDASQTRNASEAFEARRGNCLSLVIMTATFAKAAGQPVEYREVLVDEAWSRSGDLQFASGHVHLALGWPIARQRSEHDTPGSLVVDFLPPNELRGLRSRPIEQSTILAMYMNNRAAEALARGVVDDAYWWAREAIRQDRSFLNAYNTLAVVYTRHGQPRWALPVFEAVLERDSRNTKVMANLVAALRAEGRHDEAQDWGRKLASLEPFPPFHFLDAGQAAMRVQDWRGARDLFRKELARQSYNPELHFWLAQANYRLGNVREAGKHLELAQANSTTPQETAIYAAKLAWLRANGSRQ